MAWFSTLVSTNLPYILIPIKVFSQVCTSAECLRLCVILCLLRSISLFPSCTPMNSKVLALSDTGRCKMKTRLWRTKAEDTNNGDGDVEQMR
jgi:hypothetical protein